MRRTALYHQPGQPITASTGDKGFGAQYPATSRWVIAVGGTHLTRTTTGRLWTETVWKASNTEATGSGCSTHNPAVAPASFNTGCTNRAEADVSAVADPATGVAVYDTFWRVGLACLRGDQRVGADRRRRPCPAVQHVGRYPAGAVRRHRRGLLRRDVGQQRVLQPVAALHGTHRLGRPDRPRHAELLVRALGRGCDASIRRRPMRSTLAVAYEHASGVVRANMVVSADGAATVENRSGLLSSLDHELFLTLRKFCDVILVGASTVRVEGYGPARGQSPPPIAVVSACRPRSDFSVLRRSSRPADHRHD